MKSSLLVICMMLFISFLNRPVNADSNKVAQIRKAIAEKGAKWQAGENWVTRLSLEEQRRLCGTILEPPDPALAKLLTLPMIEDLPAEFDWRDNNGNWVTPVRNQGNCGSCWDFSAVAQVEAWWKIYHANLDSMIDLSEQYVLSCSEGSCNGWTITGGLEFIRTMGIPTEECFPYQANDEIPCTDACSDWEDEAVKIPGWGFITLDEAIIDNIKNAVYHHPVSAVYMVYEDFFYYQGGTYEHTWGDIMDGHAILLVGWNDAEQSWICKNSWGTEWGETVNFTLYTPEAGDGGYFRIKWGECSFGVYTSFIWDESEAGPVLTVSPDQLDFTLTAGDSSLEHLTVSNSGESLLQFSAIDYAMADGEFHPDDFNAWDGLSWWCADPKIGGYWDRWLQYLDTPLLYLSNTSSPQLSWMGFWALEEPVVWEDYDGFDGCNVWISIDGGSNYQVLYPQNPSYNCQSLVSFGSEEWGWNMGPGIAGWAGSSDGWIPITHDLSTYKSDSVIIRFSFASDGGLSTTFYPELFGFFVDDIIVSDGSNVLFHDQGENPLSMYHTGYGRKPADWLELSNAVNFLEPDEFTFIDIAVKTGHLDPGNYQGSLRFYSNDTTNPGIEIPCNLQLLAPEHDVALKHLLLSNRTVPLFTRVFPKVRIQNCGLQEATDFDLRCTAAHTGQPLHDDTTHVNSLSINGNEMINLNPFSATDIGTVDLKVGLINCPEDYNRFNNSIGTNLHITNLVDGFEEETNLWTYEGGWGIITSVVNCHSGTHAVHVNQGESPYENNMDAILSYKLAFDYSATVGALLKYWARYQTEEGKDIFYLEVSGDSMNWTKIDSISGTARSWEQREVPLPVLDDNETWIRFHFVSDSQVTMFGVLIDDIEIYVLPETDIKGEFVEVPLSWNLQQNYPNPFNPITNIEFALPHSGFVSLKIYNMLGEEVATLVSDKLAAGKYKYDWDASGYASGLYFYRIETDNFSSVKKCLLLK